MLKAAEAEISEKQRVDYIRWEIVIYPVAINYRISSGYLSIDLSNCSLQGATRLDTVPSLSGNLCLPIFMWY